MIPFHELIIFVVAALILVLSPGPNMIYLISRAVTQGRRAGIISLFGVITGFLFHILMVSLGLTAILLTIPFAYALLKSLGVVYLLYLAYQAIKPSFKSIFENKKQMPIDTHGKLFRMGFITNVLNPKVAVFYLSFFPQFIKPEYGSVMLQSLMLGIAQISVSFSVNLLIVLTASRVASFFQNKPGWLKFQRWFMASVLTALAIKMALEKNITKVTP